MPALALGIDPISPGIMERKPRKKKEGIITKNTALNIVFIGILMSIACLALFANYYKADLKKAQTVVFTTLVVLEIVRLYMIRSEYKLGLFSNKYLVLAVISSIALQLAVLYTPLNQFFIWPKNPLVLLANDSKWPSGNLIPVNNLHKSRKWKFFFEIICRRYYPDKINLEKAS